MRARRATAPPGKGDIAVLTDDDIAELAEGLAALPPPLAPLDASALDGFLCAVLVQPRPPARSRWLPWLFDEAGAAAPASAEVERLAALVDRRFAELKAAIEARAWFDPWVFTIDDADAADPIGAAAGPWAVGFAGGLNAFPELLDQPSAELDEALAGALRFIDPDELEDAAGLFAAIEELAPPSTLAEAVEGLTRSVLLLADVAAARRSGR